MQRSNRRWTKWLMLVAGSGMMFQFGGCLNNLWGPTIAGVLARIIIPEV